MKTLDGLLEGTKLEPYADELVWNPHYGDDTKYQIYEAINIETGDRKFILHGQFWDSEGNSVAGGRVESKDMLSLASNAWKKGFYIEKGDELRTISRIGIKHGYRWVTGPVTNDDFFKFYQAYLQKQNSSNKQRRLPLRTGKFWNETDENCKNTPWPIDPNPTRPPTPLT